MAILIYRPLFWILLVLQMLLLLWLARRLRLRWLPTWLLRAALVALCLAAIFAPWEESFSHTVLPRQVLLLDVSDSIPHEMQQQMRLQAWEWRQAQANRFLVIYGSTARVVLESPSAWPALDGRDSNLVSALQLATDLLGNQPGRVTLASDGLVTAEAEVEEMVERLARQGHRLDVLPLPALRSDNDLFVSPLSVAPILWEDTPFTAVLPIFAPDDSQATVHFIINGQPQPERHEQLTAGENYVVLTAQAQSQGIMTLEAAVLLENDPWPENNHSYATVQVFPAPVALFVSENIEQDDPFIQALRDSGVQIETLSPDRLPIALPELEQYQVVFLSDLPARSLSHEQMMALRVFVSRRGGGLIFLGGRHSYTLGEYQNSVLAPLMPVKLEPPPRQEWPPTTFVIVLDRSGSMSIGNWGEARPIALAREAAMRAIEILGPNDYLGVMTFSTTATWDVPLARAGDGLVLRQAQDAISQISAYGATNMHAAMSLALAKVESIEEIESSLILLLTDGYAGDGSREEFEILANRARDANINISTIALGRSTDEGLLRSLAEVTDGRYHRVQAARDLPRVMVAESQAAQSEHVQRGRTDVIISETAHPVLFGLRPNELPELSAYNALASRAEEGAEDILLSGNFQDPILSVWQYGLGRVVTWTGDSGHRWAADWTNWPGQGQFWGQVVRYALLNPTLGPAQVNVRPSATQLNVQVRLHTELDVPLNWANPQFTYVDAEEMAHTYAIPQVAPGLYTLEAPLPPMGAYRAVVRYEAGPERIEVGVPFAINFPAEWQPADPEIGHQRLLRWAEATGGGQARLDESPEGRESFRAQQDADALLWRLLQALVFLWPVEIAIRRRWLPWR
jgi:Ca-activated chloride channel homolog